MVLLLLACAEDPYTLELHVHLPEGGEDLVSKAAWSLVATDDGGERTVLPLEVTDGSALGVPPLPDATVALGLLAAEGSADPEDLSGALAWGEVAFEGRVPQGERASADLFVAPFGAVLPVGNVAPARRSLGGALAVDSHSRVWVAGGQVPGQSRGDALDKVFRMDLDAGETSLEASSVTLPKTQGEDANTRPLEYEGRVNLSATAVQVNGQDRILVAGGNPRIDYPFAPTDQALLIDPENETVDTLKMPTARAGHVAIRFANGDVLLYGGFIDNGFPRPSFVNWTAARGFRDSTASRDTGAVHAAGAPFGEDIVVCGGDTGSVVAGNQQWTPQAGCVRIRGNGQVADFDPLPQALSGLAMAPMPDGGLLVAGGFTEPAVDVIGVDGYVESFGTAPAVGKAFRWTAAAGWKPVDPLKSPRAHHAMIPLADGSVLVVGGDSRGNPFLGSLVAPVRCPERFDPATDEFALLDPCPDATTGAYPMVGWWPGGDAAVLSGYTYDSEGLVLSGGSEVGAATVGP